MVTARAPIRADLEERVELLLSDLCIGFGKVATRFVRDMLLGMELSHSPRLSDIADVLDEGIGRRATHKRLSRNLARRNLHQTLSQNLLNLSVRQITDHSLLFLDWPTLLKERAEKMEHLNYLSDTRGDQVGKGYHLAEIVASELTNDHVTPIAQDIWPEIQGESDFLHHTLTLLERVQDASGGKGVVVADRGGDHPVILQRLVSDPCSRFLIRLRRHTELLYRRHTFTAGALASKCETPYGRNVLNAPPDDTLLPSLDIPLSETVWKDGQSNPTQFLHFGFLPVRLPALPDRNLAIVVIHGTAGAPIILLTSEPIRNNRDVITPLVDAYMRRWRTKITRRQFHDRHQFSRIRVLTYDRIRNLAALVFALEYLHARAHADGKTDALMDDFHLVEAGIDLSQTKTASRAG